MKRSDFETFLTVARMSSFHKAADALHTVQSNVSARIADLERRLGQPLFDRQRGGVKLTRAGLDLIPYAEDVLHSMDRFERASGAEAQHSGTLRLSMSETMVALLFPKFAQEFSNRFPNADLEIMIDTTSHQRQQLLDQSSDLAFLLGPISEYEIANRPLASLPMKWIVPSGHPAARRGHLDLADLSELPILTYSRMSRPYSELASSCAEHGIRRPRLLSSNSINATLALVSSGYGVATLPLVIARPALDCGDVCAVTADIPLSDLVFTASYLDRSPSTLVVEAARMAGEIAAAL